MALSGDGMVGRDRGRPARRARAPCSAVLPGGRGNDLARVLGDPARTAVRRARTSRRDRRARWTSARCRGAAERGRTFVGIASAGFDSDANRIANEAPSWLGGLVYAYGALRALGGVASGALRDHARALGRAPLFVGYSVVAANSKAYGGGMFVAPEALLDDGQLEVVVIERVGKLRFLTNLPKVFRGDARAAAPGAGAARAGGRDLRGPAVRDVRRRRPHRRAARCACARCAGGERIVPPGPSEAAPRSALPPTAPPPQAPARREVPVRADGRSARAEARARTRRRGALAAQRRRRHERARQGAAALDPGAIGALGGAAAARAAC